MYLNQYFALQDIQVDPDINDGFALFFVILILSAMGMILWHFAPILVRKVRNKRSEKIELDNRIWFDTHKSILHKGSRQVSIPESSLEYYVCKLVFNNPRVYQDDWDVLHAANEPDRKDRAVYFAVDRINGKAKRAFKLEGKLLKRGKQKTRLNDNYF